MQIRACLKPANKDFREDAYNEIMNILMKIRHFGTLNIISNTGINYYYPCCHNVHRKKHCVFVIFVSQFYLIILCEHLPVYLHKSHEKFHPILTLKPVHFNL